LTYLSSGSLRLCALHNATAIYTHLAQPNEALAIQAVNRVVADLWDQSWLASSASTALPIARSMPTNFSPATTR